MAEAGAFCGNRLTTDALKCSAQPVHVPQCSRFPQSLWAIFKADGADRRADPPNDPRELATPHPVGYCDAHVWFSPANGGEARK